jgi:hypothetical protein
MTVARRHMPETGPPAGGAGAVAGSVIRLREPARAPGAPIWRLVSGAPGEGAVPTRPWGPGAGAIGCGSLVVECRFPDTWRGHRTLIHHRQDNSQTHDFMLGIDAESGVSLAQRQGGRLLRAGAPVPGGGLSGAVILGYHWDEAARFWSLAIEDVLTGAVSVSTGHDPQPFPAQALGAMIDAATVGADDAVIWAGVAEGRMPVAGPMPGLAAQSLILTPTGYVAAADLRPGDLVTTRDMGAQPLLWSAGVRMPGRGACVPEVIRANYLGARRDLCVLPRQRIVVGGAEVEYLFGEEEVLVEAGYFVHGRMAVSAPSGGMTQYIGLVFAEPDLICANGCWVESLWLGTLARHPERVAASCLAGAAARLPVHTHTARRVLKGYEARTLAAMRVQNGIHR